MERVLLFAAIVAALLVGYALLRRWQVRRLTGFINVDPLLADLRPGTPTIVYFTSPTCAPCLAQQKPALRVLLSDLGEGVQVIEVDASAEPEAASRWGVMSVPTTFVLDAQGQPRQVNHGLVGADKLRRQVLAI